MSPSETNTRTTYLSPSKIADLQTQEPNKWLFYGYFKLLSFGEVCYAAIDKWYMLNICSFQSHTFKFSARTWLHKLLLVWFAMEFVYPMPEAYLQRPGKISEQGKIQKDRKIISSPFSLIFTFYLWLKTEMQKYSHTIRKQKHRWDNWWQLCTESQ